MADKETRVLQAGGLRVVPTATGKRKVIGYAAVFNSFSDDLGGFRELIAPGAFTRSLASGADVRALFNHDPSLILGRTKAGTLRLAEDARGLRYEIDLPDTAYARDLVISLQRGDISGSSFSFKALNDRWAVDDRGPVRTVIEAALYDVSPVSFPAYSQTSAAARSAARLVRAGRRPRNVRQWARLELARRGVLTKRR